MLPKPRIDPAYLRHVRSPDRPLEAAQTAALIKHAALHRIPEIHVPVRFFDGTAQPPSVFSRLVQIPVVRLLVKNNAPALTAGIRAVAHGTGERAVKTNLVMLHNFYQKLKTDSRFHCLSKYYASSFLLILDHIPLIQSLILVHGF